MAGGRPKGSTKPKIMADALVVALNREADEGKTRKLAKIAEKLVDLAESGDVAAIREVFDRVDGKPHQSMDVDAALNGELRLRWMNQAEQKS